MFFNEDMNVALPPVFAPLRINCKWREKHIFNNFLYLIILLYALEIKKFLIFLQVKWLPNFENIYAILIHITFYVILHFI